MHRENCVQRGRGGVNSILRGKRLRVGIENCCTSCVLSQSGTKTLTGNGNNTGCCNVVLFPRPRRHGPNPCACFSALLPCSSPSLPIGLQMTRSLWTGFHRSSAQPGRPLCVPSHPSVAPETQLATGKAIMTGRIASAHMFVAQRGAPQEGAGLPPRRWCASRTWHARGF